MTDINGKLSLEKYKLIESGNVQRRAECWKTMSSKKNRKSEKKEGNAMKGSPSHKESFT